MNDVIARNMRTCRTCKRTKPLACEWFGARLGKFSATCRRCERLADKARYAANRLEVLARKKLDREGDPEGYAQRRRAYYARNKASLNARATALNRMDPVRRIRCAIRTRFTKIVRAKGWKKTTSWQTLVGYSVHDLKTHIESQLPDGWDWNNYGVVWVIDHKRPVASFDLPREIRECFALPNLRPLEKMENHRKGARILEAGVLL